MAKYITNEQQFIEDNIFKYEERLSSPLNRFTDKTPIFVKYWHISNEDSVADGGYQDTEELLGPNSSLRFKSIENMPLFGMEQFVAQLNDGEQGLDTTIESEATTAPGTLRPVPNDMFVIHGFRTVMIYRIFNIEYDTIRPEGYYKVSFRLEFMEEEKLRQLEAQTVKRYHCIYENIGTEEKCIILTDDYEQWKKVSSMYDEMADMYVAAYYSKKHNCFLGNFRGDGKVLYDPLMSYFIDKHSLFNKRNAFSAIVLGDQFTDEKREFKYENSIYRFFERNDVGRLKRFFYFLLPGTNYHESSFHRWYDNSVLVVDTTPPLCPNDPENFLLCQEFIDAARLNTPVNSPYQKFLVDYLWHKIRSVNDIPLDLKDILISLNLSKDSFFFTPIVLYVIRETIKGFMGDKETTIE